MKLIFIYGPPASGKLTIAEKLAEHTGISVFHNHLTRDIVKNIYGDQIRKHYDLVDIIRLNVLEYCAKNQTDLIFTYVYEGEDDDENVKELTRAVEANQGEVVFIELTASRVDLIARSSDESRKKYKKITDPDKMAKITKDMDKYSIPFVRPLKINTSSLTPQSAVKVIAEELGLEAYVSNTEV